MNSLNDLEYRIQRLEALLSLEADAPLILINVRDQQRGSTDPGTVRLGIIPGRSCGYQGETLMRNPGEDQDDFLLRCDKRYSELYG